ncbi:MAG: hypothetical protein NT061_06440 [Spirochaetes bacterium]|nr:hypothetical protein [Spirochaetota bacterium]
MREAGIVRRFELRFTRGFSDGELGVGVFLKFLEADHPGTADFPRLDLALVNKAQNCLGVELENFSQFGDRIQFLFHNATL